ncbi:hypothetical protein MLD38_017114 [Melastoma candidum]|uniref:Uncharacterized protein n=1 Tax=Melastoma candidum TaxID=119954 RepID=A0ACB9QQ54_9MYRT|nr:hypothetical protein MLD38_017114 [Melastoma candidum]
MIGNLANYLRGRRRTGSPFAGVGTGFNLILSSGIAGSHLKFTTRWCKKTRISRQASSFPKHILGPPPNGRYVYGAGPELSNLDSSKLSGEEKRTGSLCTKEALHAICSRIRKSFTYSKIKLM